MWQEVDKIAIGCYGNSTNIEWVERKMKFIESFKSIIQDIDEAEALLAVKKEKVSVLKQSLIGDGAKGIQELFAIEDEIVILKARIKSGRAVFKRRQKLCGEK
jgi:hypothetical protein